MEELAFMIFEFFLEVFDRLSLYHLFPTKKRSKDTDDFLRVICYIPTFVALAIILIGGCMIGFGWGVQYHTACFIAMAASALYLLIILVLNYAIGE